MFITDVVVVVVIVNIVPDTLEIEFVGIHR